MGAIDFSALGLVIASVTGIGSFLIGRHLRKGRVAKKQAEQRAAAQATQSRQVRRARQRTERK